MFLMTTQGRMMKTRTVCIAAYCFGMLALTPSAHAWGDREQAALAGAVVGGLIASHAPISTGLVGYPAPVGAPVYVPSVGIGYPAAPGFVTAPVYAPAPTYLGPVTPVYRAPAYIAGPTVGLYGPGWRSPIPPVVQYRPFPGYAPTYAPAYAPGFRERGERGERGYWGGHEGGWEHGHRGRHGGW